MHTSHFYSSQQCTVSSDSAYIASAVNERLVIRTNASEPAILHVFEAIHPIQHVAWSPNSKCILTVNFLKGVIQVWSLADTHWRGKITETGLTRVWWGADTTTILCSSEEKLRIAVWMLVDQQVRYIKYPKFYDKGCECSPDKNYMAIVESHQGKDAIGIYNPSGTGLLTRFSTDTSDLANMRWSPDSSCLAIWDHPLYYRLLVYRPDGSLLASYQAYDHGLGIKTVAWSPDSQLLAIGSYDQKVRILRTADWSAVGELVHSTTLDQRHKHVKVCQENSLPKSVSQVPKYDAVARRPFNIPMLRPEYSSPNPKIGVGFCQFSSDSRYLITRDEGMPTVAWLWDISTLSCTMVVLQQQVIRQLAWNPTNPDMLAMNCNNHYVYLIERDPAGVRVLTTKASDFSVRKFSWSKDGKSLLLKDNSLFCLAIVQ
ncbi:hypothetical protein BX666DRAFT_2029282 [Dichotomocladium elegans]|nr:hypothetical protein BX666DRAFT_2029282 [Dichotomocladium elegans]